MNLLYKIAKKLREHNEADEYPLFESNQMKENSTSVGTIFNGCLNNYIKDTNDEDKKEVYGFIVKLPIKEEKIKYIKSIEGFVCYGALTKLQFPYALMLFDTINHAKGSKNILSFNEWTVGRDVYSLNIPISMYNRGVAKYSSTNI